MGAGLGTNVLGGEAEEAAQGERGAVGDDFGVFDLGEFLGFVHGVVEVAEFINESAFEGLVAGEDAAVGEGVFEVVDFKAPLGGDDADEFFVDFLDEGVDHLCFFGGGFSGGVENVFIEAGFEGVGFDTDFVHEASEGEALEDDANAAGKAEISGHHVAGAHGGVESTAGADGFNGGDDGFVFVVADVGEGLVDGVGGDDFAAGGIDAEDDGFDVFVFDGLVELGFEVADHTFFGEVAIASTGDDAGEVNDGDFVFRVGIALDEGFLVGGVVGGGGAFAEEQGEEDDIAGKADAKEKDGKDAEDDPAGAFGWAYRCRRHREGRLFVHSR